MPEVWYTEELELMQVLSRQHGIPSISLDDFEIEAAVTDLVPLAFVREHRLIPINRIGTTLIIAMVDPSNVHALAALFEQTGLRIDPVLASEPELARAIRRHYRHGPDPSRRNR